MSAQGIALIVLGTGIHERHRAPTGWQIGQPVELKVDSLVGEKFIGSVRRTACQLDHRTRTLRVEAELEPSQTLTRVGTGHANSAKVDAVDANAVGVDRASLLRPGMFGMVTLAPSAFDGTAPGE